MRLRIEKAIYGGSGLARIGPSDLGREEAALAGKTVFTPLTLPGELVEAHITEDKRSFIHAEADAILEPSLLRTTPGCPYFGSCGGCSYQHAVSAHQLEMKAAILVETLERARLAKLPPVHTVSGESWRYRNRIRLHIQAEPFALCYRERRSHELLAVVECPIAAPLLEKALVTVTNGGKALGLASLCEEIEFFTNSDESALAISFITSRPATADHGRLTMICESLKRQLPELTGASLVRTQGRQPGGVVQSWGEASLRYRACNTVYRVSGGAFFQVNRFLVEALAELVTGNRAGRVAWDLYAGVGLFARALTERFERVIAVEASPASIADLRQNLEGTSHRVVEATTLDFLRKQKTSSTPPDLVVIDPPRAGLGSIITTLLSGIGPEEIVYVSCDPATLSRDLAALVESGYDLKTITMVDLFPQTFHLESVCVLTRR